ncbi:Camphor resistance family isoform 1 [Chlorella sorokiniana]|uniref:Camphor resistance family isoform 1 n=1 Tax=Chlorella sorokiniana TaxID=3076 RepID=A0A2P6TL11_CHLSO|nr:Camphor resistance family isoform 1 [Chlorella sorokiniana]|eukprot:PRW44982.1 Camphor resistance family isoform 1 [Chlorella sorokiniana]
MLRKRDSAGLRLAITLIHLALWAQLGVATRAFLAKFFTLGCNGGSSWAPCLEGVWFRDLPANLLGSFIIGLFAASSSAGLAVDKALVLLPPDHPWQQNFELQIGIRTGYCGSLTTFASWNLELVTLGVVQAKWGQAVAGYFVGMCGALVAYCVGLHAALLVDRWISKDRNVLAELAQYRSKEVQYISGQLDQLDGAGEQLMEQAEPDIPRILPDPQARASLRQALSTGLELQTFQTATSSLLMEAEPDLPRITPSRISPTPSAAGAAGAAGAAAEAAEQGAGAQPSPFDAAQQPDGLRQRQHRQPSGLPPGKPSPNLLPSVAQPDQRLTAASFGESLRGYRTDGLALLLLLALTAALATGVGVQSDHEWLRTIWMCCLLGPFGCTLRWWLSRWNYKLPGALAWFPAGTFAANMLGTTTDFSLQCVLQRRGSALGYWGTLMIESVITGFNGSLTTVSTFITEVVKFADAIPDNFRAYTYTLLSLGCGFALGIAIYGWSVWAY